MTTISFFPSLPATLIYQRNDFFGYHLKTNCAVITDFFYLLLGGVSRLALGHPRGNSLTNMVLFAAFIFSFFVFIQRSPVLSPYAWSSNH